MTFDCNVRMSFGAVVEGGKERRGEGINYIKSS